MEVRDFLKNIEEKKMEKFLSSCFGAENIESVIKFFDESYNGYVFQVRLKNGLAVLPIEDNNSLRLGAYGFIRDDLTNPLPSAYDDIILSFEYPDFLKKYILFIKEQTDGETINGQPYIYKFHNKAMLSILSNKHSSTVTADRLFKKRKIFINDIIKNAEEQEKE